MSIKQRTGIPGGACEFDLPSYHYWLHRPAEERIGQLAAWTGPLFPLRDGSAIILRILRESGKPQRLTAPLGHDLTGEEMTAAMRAIMGGDATTLGAPVPGRRRRSPADSGGGRSS